MIWLILSLALVLRLVNLNQSLWLDEGTQVILSSKSLFSIWTDRVADFHPPLSYILTHFWLYFGTSETWLRLLPVLFGIATVGMVFLLARDIGGEKFAQLGALFMAVAPYHIYYSQELRMYSMATFFAILSMLFFWRIFAKKSRFSVVGYILSTTFLLYTHYLGLFLVLAQLLFVLFNRLSGRLIFTSWLFIFFLYFPWLPQLFAQLSGGLAIEEYLPGWRDVLSLPTIRALPLTFLKFSIGRIDFDNILVYGTIAALVLSFFGILILLGLQKLKKRQGSFLLIWLLLPLFLAILISFEFPLNQPFRLLFVLPAFYLLLAQGVSAAKGWRKFFLAGVILVSLSGSALYFTNPRFWREDWRGAVRFIKQQPISRAVVLFEFPEPFATYQWYDQGETPAFGVVKKFPAQKELVDFELERETRGKDTAYLFQYLQPLTDPAHKVEDWLVTHGFYLAHTQDIRGVGFIYEYKR